MDLFYVGTQVIFQGCGNYCIILYNFYSISEFNCKPVAPPHFNKYLSFALYTNLKTSLKLFERSKLIEEFMNREHTTHES